ncbi:MAG: AhpC/TSA family protein [Chitinophagaceae bacterium]|nr:MAG: AhpC/TSA family protein [Chitinophagaceae bacterium]
MKKNPLLLLLVLLCAIGAAAQGKKLRIEGSISGLPHVRFVQLMYTNQFSITQPVAIVDGVWSISLPVNMPRLALLSFISDEPLNHSKDTPIYRYNIPLFLSPGRITVQTKDVLARTRIEGSEAHDDYLKLVAAAAPYEREIQRWRELSADSALLNDLPRQVYIGRKVDSVTAVFREQVYGRFLALNIASPLTPHILSAYWHLHGDPERMLQFLVNLPVKYRYPHLNAFRDDLQKFARVSAGQQAPDFKLRDTSGAEVTLASFRGKYVLIDFWGSWCVPCRLEAPNLVEAFNYFRGRNLALLGVAVERNRSDKGLWLKAIREDSLPGTQVSDFRYWESPVLKKFAVLAVPQNVLIDPNGQILARNLTGEHLWAVLDRLLP